MIKVVPYEPAHLGEIQLRECHHGEKVTEIDGSAITFLTEEGVPLAIFGGYPVCQGTFQAWGLLSNEIRKCPISFHKTVKLLVDYYMNKWELRRIQISVVCGFNAGWDWAQSLGFSVEGVMKKYGPDGQDYWLFARTV